ncbi:MAG: FHA domain-containing protein [Phycisphaerales bacterium]|nr:FHA domain-containing protein [Phycisphaerales bacterium]
MAQKFSISYDDVNDTRVDERIKRQDEATRSYQPAAPPVASTAQRRKRGFWYNTAVYTTFFGLIGGIAGWACGELPRRFIPNHKAQYDELVQARQMIEQAAEQGRLQPAQAHSALERLGHAGMKNPYYQIEHSQLDDAQREQARQQLTARSAQTELIANIFFFAAAGLIVATALAIADALVERNTRAMLINGSVGATLGLLGGAAAALVLRWIQTLATSHDSHGLSGNLAIQHMIAWGTMGLFLAAAPGLVMRNRRKLTIGLLGGVIGGVLGGLMFEPIATWAGYNISRLLAISAIGMLTGLAVGLIENVAKRGWLKVTAGLIAGKQFVLYRNPTYIGSALSCSIYLFRDPAVGPRHAAIHLVSGGFEIENLPLGTPTLINARPISRQRLRDGDEIRVGSTTLVFHEKAVC